MPKFKKWRSEKLVSINPQKYKIDWDGKSRSKFQSNVKKWFQQFWKMDICVEEMPMPGTRCKLDFANLSKKIIVEVNGAQHSEFSPFFHGKNRWNFHDQIVRDSAKREWAEANGFQLIEIELEDLPLTSNFIKSKFRIEL